MRGARRGVGKALFSVYNAVSRELSLLSLDTGQERGGGQIDLNYRFGYFLVNLGTLGNASWHLDILDDISED